MAVCPSRCELEDFLSNRLPAESENHVLTHVESCTGCQQILENLTAWGVREREPDRRESATPEPSTLPRQIGQYSLIRELGQGGMGVVYLAEQVNLKRLVALKVIRHGVNATPDEVNRFCAEAEAVARLQHPNIVQIYEVGSEQGVHYLALEYVNGRNLDELVAGTPQEPPAAARITATLARAVQHAHERGILHRDLKPANILIQTTDGTDHTDQKSPPLSSVPSVLSVVKITDFGLAKRLEHGQAQSQTGVAMGTPSYMAPEQTSGKLADITPAVDVYGLGALLYEMLTGRPPFKGATLLSTLEQVMTQEPLAPSAFQRQIPRDLDTICLKCLEKERSKRYASAQHLADDLERFLAGRPIVARPIRVWGRLWKWARRRPLDASLAAAIILVAVIGLTGILWQWRHAVTERDRARLEWYRANVAAAASALQLHDSRSARQSLNEAPAEFRNCWEWLHFKSQLDSASHVLAEHRAPVIAVAVSPDGERLVSASEDQTLRLWQAATGRAIAVARGHTGTIRTVAFSPDDRVFASGGDDQSVRLWDAHTGTVIGVCSGHTGSVWALAFSRDGKRLASAATADVSCRIWDVASGKLITKLPALGGKDPKSTLLKSDASLTFTPDGTQIAFCESRAVRVVDLATRKEVAAPDTPGTAVCCCAWSRDGRHLVTGSDYPDSGVRLWDLASGKLLPVMRGHTNRVNSVAFSQDGKHIVSASQDRTVCVWDVGSDTPADVLHGHSSSMMRAAFNPDGTRIVAAAKDGTLWLWDASNGKLISVLHGHEQDVAAFAFRPDGKLLASASLDHTVRLWDMDQMERSGVLRGHESYVYDVAFSPDGTRIFSSAWDNRLLVWDAATGRPTVLQDAASQRSAEAGRMLAVAVSPDGNLVVTGSRASKIQFWDVKEARLQRTVELAGNGVESLAFSPDGQWLAAALGNLAAGLKSDGRVQILDTQSGDPVRALTGHTDAVLAVRFAPDSRRLASAGYDNTVRLWDPATSEMLAVAHAHRDAVNCVAFNEKGSVLASGSNDGSVRLWDPHTLAPLCEPLPQASIVYAVAFGHDDRRLAVGCDDGTIRLWDVAARQKVAELRGHNDYVHALAFSPDGSRLVSASGDFTLRLWDTLSPQERRARTR
jgi:WD40 repeat protein/serine/threonine protein kinase